MLCCNRSYSISHFFASFITEVMILLRILSFNFLVACISMNSLPQLNNRTILERISLGLK